MRSSPCSARWTRPIRRITFRSDVVVNHLMQLVAVAAMEAPAGSDAQTLKDAKFAVFRAMDTADPAHYVQIGRGGQPLDAAGRGGCHGGSRRKRRADVEGCEVRRVPRDGHGRSGALRSDRTWWSTIGCSWSRWLPWRLPPEATRRR